MPVGDMLLRIELSVGEVGLLPVDAAREMRLSAGDTDLGTGVDDRSCEEGFGLFFDNAPEDWVQL